jgi:predicted PurR-regulated permease PerM
MVATQSTTSQPGLNRVIVDALKAESDGAQPDQMMRLINGLNTVLHLQDQLNGLSTQNMTERQHLQQEINTTLSNLDSEAKQIDLTASQQTWKGHILAYVFGFAGALIATIVIYCAFTVRRIARRKRALQMRIVPK